MTTIIDKAHQTTALAVSKGREYFGYWMDPGTGKTRVTLKDAWRAHQDGLIDAVIVLAPNNVKADWVKWDHMMEGPDDEDQVTLHLRQHLPQIIKGLWQGKKDKADKKAWAEFEERIQNPQHKLIILAVNYEALLGEQLFEFLKAFCQEFRVMIIADESTRIGKPGSKRTKRAIKLADICAMRRALSGTPIVKTPLKIYSQARFLSKNALPFKSYFAFRNTFCVMGGFQNRQVLEYKNLDYLTGLMEKFAFRCRKDECLDLPEQIFRKKRVYMEPEQIAAYQSMRKEFFAKIGEEEITAPIVLTQIMRLQEIAGGYCNKIELVPPARNPKLTAALELIDDAPGQVVVWFRFVPELLGMARLLDEANVKRKKDRENGEPISYFKFYGDVPEKERGGIKAAFKRGERQVLLGTESTGGIGINQFVGADTVIHVSSDFDTEKRIQADDRNHRMGSERHPCINYWDILVPATVDVKIHSVLRADTKLSAKILRDKWKEWI